MSKENKTIEEIECWYYLKEESRLSIPIGQFVSVVNVGEIIGGMPTT